jgi:acyl-CoA reductase-like NAD-dependent aldehyde dehydrogenase
VKKLGETMDKQLKVGAGLATGTTQGPLINSRAVDKVNELMV